MTDKIKILFLAASPTDSSALRLGEELREIESEIRYGSQRERFELKSQWAVRPSDLQRALMDFQPHIVHFSGHGSPSEEIILEDNYGKSRPVGKQDLTGLFKALKDNVRIIVLNSCFARPQAEALSELIDYTVGASKAIKDKSAVAFAAAFYRALAHGRSVQEAFDLAKVDIGMWNLPGADILALMTRPGVTGSEPFLKQLSLPVASAPPHSTTITNRTAGVDINGSSHNFYGKIVGGDEIHYDKEDKDNR